MVKALSSDLEVSSTVLNHPNVLKQQQALLKSSTLSQYYQAL